MGSSEALRCFGGRGSRKISVTWPRLWLKVKRSCVIRVWLRLCYRSLGWIPRCAQLGKPGLEIWIQTTGIGTLERIRWFWNIQFSNIHWKIVINSSRKVCWIQKLKGSKASANICLMYKGNWSDLKSGYWFGPFRPILPKVLTWILKILTREFMKTPKSGSRSMSSSTTVHFCRTIFWIKQTCADAGQQSTSCMENGRLPWLPFLWSAARGSWFITLENQRSINTIRTSL